MPPPTARSRVPVPLIAIAVLFVLVMAWLIAAALVPHQVATYPLQPQLRPRLGTLGPDTVTLDARDPDQWTFLAFDRGPLAPPDTAGWDLASRRFHLMTTGSVLVLPGVAFDSLSIAPVGEYSSTTFLPDTQNAALSRWYRYSMFSHLLTPKQQLYVVRTRSGTAVKLEMLSYYCPGPDPGCLTFRYARVRTR